MAKTYTQADYDGAEVWWECPILGERPKQTRVVRETDDTIVKLSRVGDIHAYELAKTTGVGQFVRGWDAAKAVMIEQAAKKVGDLAAHLRQTGERLERIVNLTKPEGVE